LNTLYNTSGQDTDGNMAHAHCMLETYGSKHTLGICNSYCFSTATMVTRTRLSVNVLRRLPVLFLHVHVFKCVSFVRISQIKYWLCYYMPYIQYACKISELFNIDTRRNFVKFSSYLTENTSPVEYKNKLILCGGIQGVSKCRILCYGVWCACVCMCMCLPLGFKWLFATLHVCTCICDVERCSFDAFRSKPVIASNSSHTNLCVAYSSVQ
jgi:hypothetical protein